MRKTFLQLTCILLFVALPLLLATGGSFDGKVTNAQGKPVPNAAVTLTNSATNAKVKVLSGPDGSFAINGVPPGTYQLDVETQGYKHATQHGLVLPPQGTSFKITLEAGSMNETVEIRGTSPTVETQNGEMNLGIETRQVREIPIIDRNYQQLAGLQSGVTPPTALLSQTVDPERNRFFSVNGQSLWNNQWRLEGLMNQEPFRNTAIRIQPVESIQQFNVVTAAFSAPRGFIGGSDDYVVTAPGTNSFHGQLFEFWNGTRMNARNFFNQDDVVNGSEIGGQVKPRWTYNQFGAAGGGAIAKDKTFLFGSYQGMFANGQQTQLTTVPTAAMLTGNFSAVPGLVLYNPNSGLAGFGRTPFAGNIIPTGMLSPLATTIASFYPAPNLPGFSNNFASNVPLNNHQQKADGRIDQHFSDTTNLFLRYGFSNDWVQQNSPIGQVIGDGTRSRLIAQNAVIDLTHTFGPRLIGDARFGYNRFDQRINASSDQTALASALGTAGLINPINFTNNSLTGMNITGFAPIGSSAFVPEHAVDNTFNWIGALSWHTSRNDIKLGADVRRIRADGFTDSLLNSQFGPNGTAYFGPGATLSASAVPGFGPNSAAYNSFAAFLLGQPTQIGVSNYFTTPTIRQTVYGIWLMDTLHPFRNLTVELGIRYENYGSLEPRADGGAQVFDPLTNTFSFVGLNGVTDEQGHFSSVAIAPRVGLAYRFGSKTVFRAGYSMHYFQPPYALSGYMPSAFGFASGVNGSFVTAPGGLPITVPNPTPTTPLVNGTPAGQLPASVVPLNVSTPYVHSFNAQIQRDFYWGTMLSVGYVGELGRFLPFIEQVNSGLPGTGLAGLPLIGTGRTASTLFFDNGVTSNYNSLQVNLNKRFSKGVSFIGSYTYSKALGYTTSNNLLLDPFNFRANYGPLDTDQRNLLSIGYLWELPFGRNSKGWQHAVLGGWQVNGFFTWSDGTPITVTSNNLFCGCINSTPFANFFGNAFSNTGTQILNPASFSSPVNSFGNIGRAPFYAPGFRNMDLSVFKNFQLRDRYTLQFRGEAFNVGNAARFQNPVSNVSATDFGQQVSTVPGPYNNWGRQINLALRLMF
jgi:hypothetical protein